MNLHFGNVENFLSCPLSWQSPHMPALPLFAVCFLLLCLFCMYAMCVRLPLTPHAPSTVHPQLARYTHTTILTPHTNDTHLCVCVCECLCYPWNSLTCAHCKVLCLPTDNRQFCPFLGRRRCCCSLAIVINKL